MGHRLSVRLFAGLCAAALVPLILAGTLLMPALQQGAVNLRMGGVRTLADSVEPLYGGMWDRWLDAAKAVAADAVVAKADGEDAGRLEALLRWQGNQPDFADLTLHRASGLPISTRSRKIPHPAAAVWARLGTGGVLSAVHLPEGQGAVAEVSLLVPVGARPGESSLAELLELHLRTEVLSGPVGRIESEEVALVDDRGQVLAHRNPAWIGRRFGESLSGAEVFEAPVRTRVAGGLASPWRVVVRLPKLEAAQLQSRATSLLVLSGLVGLGLCAGAAWWMARWLQGPLQTASDAMARLEQRDFSVRVRESGPPVLSAMNRRLNGLAKKLEAAALEAQVQRERLEKRLEEAQVRTGTESVRVRAVGEGSRDGFLLLEGEEQRVCWWNARFAQFGRFTGSDLETLDARQILQRVAWQFADSGRFMEWWFQVAGREQEMASQIWALRQPEDGMARVSVFKVDREDGTPFGFLWRFEDRTEEARLQRQARDVERAELIGNLTTGMAHEFNRILTRIVAEISTLDQLTGAEEKTRTIGQAREAAGQAAAICRGLLGYSRHHLLEARINSVRAILTWLRDQLADGLGPEHEIRIELPEKNIHVTADRGRIRSVLLELCANSIRSMPSGGTLRVTAELLQIGAGQKDPEDAEGSRFVCFTVTDNGSGIPENLRARIFEPFFTTDPRANGLGLAVVSGIAWQHGGWLTCTSEEGRGTTMRVYIPASELPVTVVVEDSSPPPEARRVDQVASGAEPGKGTEKVASEACVLVVEDEDGIRRLNQAILQRAGIASVGARSGEEGLALYQEYRDRIRLIVLDLNMPGMSGAEMFRILRAEGSFVPVIVVSAYLLDFDAFAMDFGARPAGFLQKPYQADQFLQQVSAVMAISPGSGQEVWARAQA
jgi:signal transduction histidine kinase/CheY-like chemotaxis protein